LTTLCRTVAKINDDDTNKKFTDPESGKFFTLSDVPFSVPING
jgi:hypothetical protein